LFVPNATLLPVAGPDVVVVVDVDVGVEMDLPLARKCAWIRAGDKAVG
jgi:hypothetical protein